MTRTMEPITSGVRRDKLLSVPWREACRRPAMRSPSITAATATDLVSHGAPPARMHNPHAVVGSVASAWDSPHSTAYSHGKSADLMTRRLNASPPSAEPESLSRDCWGLQPHPKNNGPLRMALRQWNEVPEISAHNSPGVSTLIEETVSAESTHSLSSPSQRSRHASHIVGEGPYTVDHGTESCPKSLGRSPGTAAFGNTTDGKLPGGRAAMVSRHAGLGLAGIAELLWTGRAAVADTRPVTW